MSPARRRGEQGFSLLELVVALTVFAVFAAGVYAMIHGGLNLARNNKNRSIAANLASQEMDKVRAADFTALPIGLVRSTQSVDGAVYTVQRESEWVATDATASPCDSAGATPNYLRVTVKVFWSAMRGVTPVQSATVVRPPVGAYDPNSGHIAVKVLDRNAAPSVAQPVHVVGPGVNATISTTSDGCAFFGYLPAGTYTVSMGTAGYVDRQGVVSPTQSVGVASGQVSAVGFDYDRAASLAVTLAAPDGGALPDGVPLILANTQFLPSGVRVYSGTGTTRTVTGLFPALDGYNAWTGDCERADPEGVDSLGGAGAYWDGALRPSAVPTTPGDTASATVELATVNVLVHQAGLPVAGATVNVSNPADAWCSSGNNLAAGTTAADGTLAVALPYGRWTFSVTGHTSAGAWPEVAVDPRDSGGPGDPSGPYAAVVDVQ